MYNTPVMMSTSRSLNTRTDHKDLSTPVTYCTTTKRKESKCVSDGVVAPKRSRKCTKTKGKILGGRV